MLPRRRTHSNRENTGNTEKHISHIVEGLRGPSSRCERNYLVIDRRFAGVHSDPKRSISTETRLSDEYLDLEEAFC